MYSNRYKVLQYYCVTVSHMLMYHVYHVALCWGSVVNMKHDISIDHYYLFTERYLETLLHGSVIL